MSKKRAYIRKRRSVHLRCRQKAENARKVRSRQKPVQSPESASVTFQAAATLWHRTNVARYKGATAVKYENLLRSHILPELGARQLEEINTLLLADFMNAKLHCGRLDHSGGLSSSYVRSMMLLVLDIMEFAAAEGLCPPVKTTLQTPAANRREVVILDTDALRRLETYLLAKPDITGTGILISLHTGLRISEVCALRWEDIDFRKAVLHVRSTVARVRGTDGGTATRLIIDTPKTKSSLRDIPLSRQLMAVLLPLYEKRRSEYVISDKSGFVSPRTYEYSDLKLAYGEQAPIVKEMAIIVSGLHNNFVIEDLLRDMSARCGIDDINSFAETFAVCNRLGGNLKKVVVDSRDIISDKIEIEMEIQTTVAANKNEINIMCVMPFVIIAMMGTMGQASITANTPLNVLVKLIAIFMFVIAYKLGRKIMDIKV